MMPLHQRLAELNKRWRLSLNTGAKTIQNPLETAYGDIALPEFARGEKFVEEYPSRRRSPDSNLPTHSAPTSIFVSKKRMEQPNAFFAFLDEPLYASEKSAAFVEGGFSLATERGSFPDENAENAPPVATEVGPREPTHPLHPREPGREPSHRGQWLTAVYLQNRLERHNNPHPDPYDPHPDDPYSKRRQDEVHLSLGPSAMRTEEIPKEMRIAKVEKWLKGVRASQEEIPKEDADR